jgi:hypothetical protein
LDHQVLAFFSLIAARITADKLRIQFTTAIGHMDENQLDSVNRLLQIFSTTISSMHFVDCLSNIQFLPDLDTEIERIDGHGIVESDIPILIQFLASPRPDGKLLVIKIYRCVPLAQKLLEAIKEVWWKSIDRDN